MSAQIFNLTSKPNLVEGSNNPNEVIISWDGNMPDENDNPVSIELNILPGSPVFFLTDSGENVSTVTWDANFVQGFHQYQETLFVNVTASNNQTQVTKIRMDSIDNKGFKSSSITFLMFK